MSIKKTNKEFNRYPKIPLAKMSFAVPSKISNLNFGIKEAIWLFGKICIIAGIFFAFKTFNLLGNYESIEKDLKKFQITTPIDATNNDEKNVALDEYKLIVDRNIFGKSAPVVQSTTNKETSLKLKLVGTNVSTEGLGFALIEDTNNNEQDAFDLNEMVFGQAKLVEILADRVKVEFNGQTETLVLEEGPSVASTDSTETSPTSTEFVIAEEDLNNELANLPRLLSQARAVPFFRNGRSVGMRLFAIRSGSLYEKLGLVNGDIIKSANDTSLANPTEALKIFEKLKTERNIYVQLERAGKDVKFDYSIR
jgi:general secretion pathway protein C